MLNLITDHLDVWASAVLPAKTGGRGRTASSTKTPHGIQKLRELILELAVRGKLMPQDPNDEPASELLDRVAEKKVRLLKTRELKRGKTSSRIYSEEQAFEPPHSWMRCHLEEYLDLNWGNTSLTKSSYSDNGVVAYSAAGPDGYIPHAEFNCEGIVISAIGARCGRCFYAIGEWTAIKNTMTAIPYSGAAADVDLKFILIALSIPESFPRRGGAQPFLSLGDVRATQVAVPPLPEQHRIVAKVDELMTLCDRLEQEQTGNSNAHQTLVETLLATLKQAEGDGDFAAAWQRIAEYFDTLFTTEQSIDLLKQTLLQLAVMGKLAPQDPNDEPASELLKKIAAEKSRLIKEKKIKKQEPLLGISDDEKPYALPPGWEWVHLSELIPEFQNGVSSRGDKDGVPTTVLRLADIKDRRISLEDTRTIPINLRDVQKYQLSVGDILITRVNGSEDIVGSFILNDSEVGAIYCDHFIRMRISEHWINPSYLCLLGESSLVRNKIRSLFITTAGQKTVNQGHIGSLLIAVPPLAEQSSIVAKVDELMTICDALKVRLNEAQITQVQLADAIVEQAVA